MLGKRLWCDSSACVVIKWKLHWWKRGYMPISLPCTNLHAVSLTQYNPFLNGHLTRETKCILTSFSAKIAIKYANELRQICVWACHEAYAVITNTCYINVMVSGISFKYMLYFFQTPLCFHFLKRFVVGKLYYSCRNFDKHYNDIRFSEGLSLLRCYLYS